MKRTLGLTLLWIVCFGIGTVLGACGGGGDDGGSSGGSAKNCSKGKPCGNTCIAANETCHK